MLTNGDALTSGKERTHHEPQFSHWSMGRCYTNFTAEWQMYGSHCTTLPPTPWAPESPYPFLRISGPSSLQAPTAPALPSVTVLPVSSNRRSPPMAALWPKPRLPSIFSMKCFIGINQSTQIKKSRRWEIPRLRKKDNTCWNAACSLSSSSNRNSCDFPNSWRWSTALVLDCYLLYDGFCTFPRKVLNFGHTPTPSIHFSYNSPHPSLHLNFSHHLISPIKSLSGGGGASLVAQWLRICLPMQGTQVQALVQEDPTCCGATKPMHHNYWACAPQLLSLRT